MKKKLIEKRAVDLGQEIVDMVFVLTGLTPQADTRIDCYNEAEAMILAEFGPEDTEPLKKKSSPHVTERECI